MKASHQSMSLSQSSELPRPPLGIEIPFVAGTTLFVSAFGSFGLFWTIGVWRQEQNKRAAAEQFQRSGVTTVGTVTHFWHHSAFGSKSPAHDDVTYEFKSADDRVFSGSLNDRVVPLQRGSAVTVRYLPNDPMLNSLPDYSVPAQPWFSLFGLLFVGIGLGLTINLLRKVRTGLRPIAYLAAIIPPLLMLVLAFRMTPLVTGSNYTVETPDGHASVGQAIWQDAGVTSPSFSVKDQQLTINGKVVETALPYHAHIRLQGDGQYTNTHPVP